MVLRSVATLDRLSNGRSLLILGAGVQSWLQEKLHIKYRRPRSTLEAALPTIRKLLAGETVEYKGPIFGLTGKLDYSTHHKDILIYIAAGHEYLLRYSGKAADGVLLYFWPPLEYVRWAAERVRSTAGGRKVEIGAFMPLRITKEKELARRELKEEVAFYFSDPTVGPLFLERGDFESRLGSELRRIWSSPSYKPLDPIPFLPLVPDELVDGSSVIGNPGKCREKLAELEKMGVTFVALAFQTRFDETMSKIRDILS